MDSVKKERISWYIYDWANSAFSTSVITLFIGPYLTGIAETAADKAGNIFILGLPVYYGSFFAYIISISVILQLLILPVLGSIADNSNLKKTLLGIFAYIGSFATMAMYFINGDAYLFGGLLLVVANLCFGASAVMYNSYLNDIATEDRRDAVSSIGWAVGYAGGGLNLALNLILLTFKDNFSLDTSHAVRISLCSAGIWWALFTIVPMIYLKTRVKVIRTNNAIKSSITGLLRTLRESRNHKGLLLLLLSYLLYNDGVQAVIAISAQFGNKELNLSMEYLTILILVIQFVAVGGALLFNKLAGKYGTGNSIIIALILWIVVVFYSFALLKGQLDFFIMGIIIGIIMGGTQALSRSLFSKALPVGKEAEYFSLYEVSEKGTSWMGPLIFGLSLQLSQSYRLAILSLLIFFVLGLFLLFKYKKINNEAFTAN